MVLPLAKASLQLPPKCQLVGKIAAVHLWWVPVGGAHGARGARSLLSLASQLVLALVTLDHPDIQASGSDVFARRVLRALGQGLKVQSLALLAAWS